MQILEGTFLTFPLIPLMQLGLLDNVKMYINRKALCKLYRFPRSNTSACATVLNCMHRSAHCIATSGTEQDTYIEEELIGPNFSPPKQLLSLASLLKLGLILYQIWFILILFILFGRHKDIPGRDDILLQLDI